MRKTFFTFAAVALISIFIVSCNCDRKENKEETSKTEVKTDAKTNEVSVAKAYACPMKCEGDKTYDAAGKCPKCKMDMEEVK